MKQIVFSLILFIYGLFSKAQTIAVNTDLLLLTFQTYNIGAEMTISNKSTLGLNIFTTKDPYWSKGTKFVGLNPELRYYFSGRPMYHNFIGLTGSIIDYDIKWKLSRYRGLSVGGGVSIGWVGAITKRFTLDLHLGVGLNIYHHRKTIDNFLEYETPYGIVTDNGYLGYNLFPLKVGVTMSYIIR